MGNTKRGRTCSDRCVFAREECQYSGLYIRLGYALKSRANASDIGIARGKKEEM